MEEFDAALKEGNYRDAAALAERAAELDPENAAAAAALTFVRTQPRVIRVQADNTHRNGAEAEAVREFAAALGRFQGNFKEGRYEEAKGEALRALAVSPGDPSAVAALVQACEALSRQPRPASPAQCTYVGSGLRPALPRVDPAVVSALQKLLIEGEKGAPVGGAEEAEPRDESDKAPRQR
jgi:tetratricopeptide (TPR) repeat protein